MSSRERPNRRPGRRCARRWRRLRSDLVGIAVACLAAGACQGAGGSERSPLRLPPVVVVTMSEYRFDHAGPIPAGRVVFDVRNAGRELHKLALFPLDENLPPIDVQLQGSERRVVLPFAGVPPRSPGQDGTFAVDLVAGRRYALVCFLSDAAGEPHARKGMNAEFRAGAA